MGTQRRTHPGRAALAVALLAASAAAAELTVTAAPAPDRAMAPRAWRLDVVAGTQVEWTPSPGGATSPSWSPDGDRVAYCGGVTAGFGPFVLDADGGTPRRLVEGVTASQARWSPDGAWIAFTGLSRRAEPGLFLVRPDGTGFRRVATGANPAWSPDGRRLAYYATAFAPLMIDVLDLDSGETLRAASFGAFPFAWADLAFTVDGESLLYTRTSESGGGTYSGEVRRVRLRDGHDEAVTEGAGARLLGRAPGSDVVALLRARDDRGGDATLTLLDLETGEERPLLDGGPTGLRVLTSRTVANFAWSPDGRWIAFDVTVPASPGGRSGVVLVDVERGLAAPVTGTATSYGTSLSWRP